MEKSLEEIVGHLGAALMQAAPSDDQIIIDHIRSAHELALKAWRKSRILAADLLECQEFLADQMDVVDGSYGEPAPDKAMRLHSMIDETLHGPGGF